MFVVSFNCRVGLTASSKCNKEDGEAVPIPTLPLEFITILVVPVELPTVEPVWNLIFEPELYIETPWPAVALLKNNRVEIVVVPVSLDKLIPSAPVVETSNLVTGLLVPIPTLPSYVIRIFSVGNASLFVPRVENAKLPLYSALPFSSAVILIDGFVPPKWLIPIWTLPCTAPAPPGVFVIFIASTSLVDSSMCSLASGLLVPIPTWWLAFILIFAALTPAFLPKLNNPFSELT